MPRLETIFDDVFLDSLVVLGQEALDPLGGEQLPEAAPTPQEVKQAPSQVQRKPEDFALATKLVSNLSSQFLQERHQGRGGKQPAQSGQLGQSEQPAANRTQPELPFDITTGWVSMTKIYNFANWVASMAENHQFGVSTSAVNQYIMKLRGIVADYNESTGGSDGFQFSPDQDQYALIKNFLAANTGRTKHERGVPKTDLTIYERSINAADAASRGASIAVGLLSAIKGAETDYTDRIGGQIEYGNQLVNSLRNVERSIRSMMQRAGQ